MKGFFNFLSRDHCVNNDDNFGPARLQNISSCQRYIVCGGYYLGICQKIIYLEGTISYQGSLKQQRLEMVELTETPCSRHVKYDRSH